MVQIIPQTPGFADTFGAGLGQGIGAGLTQSIDEFFQNKKQERALKQRQSQLEDYLNSPEAEDLTPLQKHLIKGEALGYVPQGISKNYFGSKEDPEIEKNNYETIKKALGEKFANVWQATGQGERTNLIKAALEAKARGQDINEIFGGEIQSQAPNGQTQEQQIGEDAQAEVDPSVFKFPELQAEKGLLGAETIKREDKRETTNVPLYNGAKDSYKSLQKQGLDLQLLNRLSKSEKLPSGFGRWNVNLKKGELRFPFLASPEAQLFVKTVNDFTTQAKETFGARVSNFELDSFMRRLPTLMNSDAGRELIIERMSVVNELNQLEQKGLIDTFNHYGVGKINSQKASQIADQYTEKQKEELVNRARSLDEQMNDTQKELKKLPKGTVLMETPDGQILHVPESEVNVALQRGAVRK